MPINRNLDSEDLAQDRADLEAWAKETELLRHLTAQPGWPVFLRALEAMGAAAFTKGFIAEDPMTVGKSFGILYAVEEIRSYPERQFEALKQRLESEKLQQQTL